MHNDAQTAISTPSQMICCDTHSSYSFH